ncbi:MAG: AsmA family protein [Gammaproteobacteria bacterium]
MSSGRRRRSSRASAPRLPFLQRWRRALVALAVLLATPPVIVAVLLATFDANRYRDDIARAASAVTGRRVVIAGDIALAPGLAPALTVSGVQLGNPDWASAAEMAHIGHAAARVRLLPLLRRRIEIVRLELRDVSLNLEHDASGRRNWTFTANAAAATHDAAAPHLAVDEIELADIAVSYQADGQAPRPFTLRQAEVHRRDDGSLRYTARADLGDTPLHIGGRLPDLDRLQSGAPAEFEFRASYDALRLTVEGELAEPAALRGIAARFRLEATTLAQLGELLGRPLPDLQRPRIEGTMNGDLDGRLRLEPVTIDIGPSALAGQLDINLDGPRPRLAGRLDARLIDVEPFVGTGRPAVDAPGLVPALPLALPGLARFDIAVTGGIDVLRLTPTLSLRAVDYDVSIADGALALRRFTAAVAGGKVEASGTLLADASPPRLVQRLRLSGMSLTPLVSDAEARNVIGGNLDLVVDFDGSGTTLAAAAATAQGSLNARVEGLEIRNRSADFASADLLLGLFEAINPLARGSDAIRVECAVANFPLRDGRLESATGLGIRTHRLNILGGGRIELPGGALDLAVDPKPREGIGLNAAALADFVRVGGTLREPVVTTDAQGLATAGLKTGAALASGGLTLVAEGLLDRSEGDVDVCAVAAGDIPPPGAGVGERATHAAGRAVEAAGSTLSRAGQALGSGIRKLFGN